MTTKHPKIRTPYDHNRVFAENNLPLITEQGHRDTCDIKFIMNRYTQTGILPNTKEREILYGEAPDQDYDLQTQQNTIIEAKQHFESLPNETSKHFKDAEHYFESINDPRILSELVEKGIIVLDSYQHPSKEQDAPPADTGAPATGDEVTSDSV